MDNVLISTDVMCDRRSSSPNIFLSCFVTAAIIALMKNSQIT